MFGCTGVRRCVVYGNVKRGSDRSVSEVVGGRARAPSRLRRRRIDARLSCSLARKPTSDQRLESGRGGGAESFPLPPDMLASDHRRQVAGVPCAPASPEQVGAMIVGLDQCARDRHEP